jgi:hypothetical protein
MKKVLVILAMLVLATAVFAQQSYVGSGYTGDNTARTKADAKLGFHDVMASPTGNNAQNAVQRNGCQSCHVPHEAKQAYYLWKYDLPTNVTQEGTAINLDAASFHTLACISCHDGIEAADVNANLTDYTGTKTGWANAAPYAMMGPNLDHNHPVNQMLSQHGATAPPRNYVRFYTPAGTSLTSTQFGYVECGSCHDPHKGDAATYDFLRGPAPGVVATDPGDGTITYTGTSPQYARLGLCRQCHGK